jgi:hypothetical protein
MRSLAIALACLWASPVLGEELVREIVWPGPSPEPGVPSYLALENREAREARLEVVSLESPGISRYTYALRGQLRHEKVEGQGYLEMWSYFPEGAFFSRTLGSGPMKGLSGTSGWREFVLPFYNKEGGPHPLKLVVNLVLPGRGTVHLGPLRLVEYAPGEDPLTARGAWWADRDAGLIGGLAGCIIGILGALAGTLASLGRARGLVFGIMKSLLAAGVAALGLGLVAVGKGQAYAVYYPLLLGGAICAFVAALTLPGLRKRYEEIELRKMRSLDAPS